MLIFFSATSPPDWPLTTVYSESVYCQIRISSRGVDGELGRKGGSRTAAAFTVAELCYVRVGCLVVFTNRPGGDNRCYSEHDMKDIGSHFNFKNKDERGGRFLFGE